LFILQRFVRDSGNQRDVKHQSNHRWRRRTSAARAGGGAGDGATLKWIEQGVEEVDDT